MACSQHHHLVQQRWHTLQALRAVVRRLPAESVSVAGTAGSTDVVVVTAVEPEPRRDELVAVSTC